jgi:hypothetical protein
MGGGLGRKLAGEPGTTGRFRLRGARRQQVVRRPRGRVSRIGHVLATAVFVVTVRRRICCDRWRGLTRWSGHPEPPFVVDIDSTLRFYPLDQDQRITVKGSRGTVTWTSGGPADVGAVHEQACQPCVDPDIGPRQHRGERLRATRSFCCTVVEAVRHGARMHQQNPRQESQQRECHDVARGFRTLAPLQLPIRVAIGDARCWLWGLSVGSRGRD